MLYTKHQVQFVFHKVTTVPKLMAKRETENLLSMVSSIECADHVYSQFTILQSCSMQRPPMSHLSSRLRATLQDIRSLETVEQECGHYVCLHIFTHAGLTQFSQHQAAELYPTQANLANVHGLAQHLQPARQS